MTWEMPSSLTRAFTLSTFYQVIFKIKSKIIGLTITRSNVKKTCGFCMQRITLVINQIKRYIEDHM